jgi:hypothetical protein
VACLSIHHSGDSFRRNISASGIHIFFFLGRDRGFSI